MPHLFGRQLEENERVLSAIGNERIIGLKANGTAISVAFSNTSSNITHWSDVRLPYSE